MEYSGQYALYLLEKECRDTAYPILSALCRKNTGLVTVEIEADHIPDAIPDWVGKNVTEPGQYSNHQLAAIPYQKWARSAEALR